MYELANNQMFLSDIIELYPTEEQQIRIWKYITASNYIYDLMIQLEEYKYEEWKNGNIDLSDRFVNKFNANEYVNNFRVEHEILKDVPLYVCRLAAYRAIQAYQYFFKGICGKPKYHYPYNMTHSFDVRCEPLNFWIEDDMVKMEGFAGVNMRGRKSLPKIRCQHRNYTRDDKFYNISVIADNLGKYWIKVCYKADIIPFPYPKSPVLGVDLGCRSDNSNTIVCSDGTIFNHPDLSRINRKIANIRSRCTKDYNYRKIFSINNNISIDDISLSKRSEERLNELRIACKKKCDIKTNFYHNTINQIIMKNPLAIVIEDIDIQWIRRRRYIDYTVNFGEILEIIKYKCKLHGIPVIVANHHYPSSKTCSNCGSHHNPNSDQIFICPNCGLRIDRDLNASINLSRISYQYNELWSSDNLYNNDNYTNLNIFPITKSELEFPVKKQNAIYFF